MVEVTVDNYESLFPRIRAAIAAAKFVAIDTEFSALYVHDVHKQSLFDTVEERYAKVRETVNLAKPLQVGLTAFAYNPDDGSYAAETFTFYTWPRPLLGLNPAVTLKASAFQFLSNHRFDYNKLIHKGLPYLTRTQEAWLSDRLETFDLTAELDPSHELSSEEVTTRVADWYRAESTDAQPVAFDLPEELKSDTEAKFVLQKTIRFRFGNKVWTEIDDSVNVLTARRVTPGEFKKLADAEGLAARVLGAALGFTKVFRLLAESGKPLIGHNLFIDLLLIYNTFEDPLPVDYAEFKRRIHRLFPAVYDTKSVSFTVARQLTPAQIWKAGSLASLYSFFKDLQGRHLALNSPLIALKEPGDVERRFHDAGWDSYCTGYVFIRMAHFLAVGRYGEMSPSRVVTSAEHFAAAADCKNRVNLIRCAISHTKLDSDDPVSTRPNWLIAQAKDNKTLDMAQITSLLSSCGSVEVKSFNEKKALIAVDNYISERQILRRFKEHGDFHITRYDRKVSRTSGFVKGFLWSGLLASSGLILFLIQKNMR